MYLLYNVVDKKGEDAVSRAVPPKVQKREEPPVVSMETGAVEEESKRAQPVGKKEERTVFVSNLSAAISEEQLKEHFRQVWCSLYIYGGSITIFIRLLCEWDFKCLTT